MQLVTPVAAGHAVLGVNLIHASLKHAGNPTAIISALMDDLSRARIEVPSLGISALSFVLQSLDVGNISSIHVPYPGYAEC